MILSQRVSSITINRTDLFKQVGPVYIAEVPSSGIVSGIQAHDSWSASEKGST